MGHLGTRAGAAVAALGPKPRGVCKGRRLTPDWLPLTHRGRRAPRPRNRTCRRKGAGRVRPPLQRAGSGGRQGDTEPDTDEGGSSPARWERPALPSPPSRVTSSEPGRQGPADKPCTPQPPPREPLLTAGEGQAKQHTAQGLGGSFLRGKGRAPTRDRVAASFRPPALPSRPPTTPTRRRVTFEPTVRRCDSSVHPPLAAPTITPEHPGPPEGRALGQPGGGTAAAAWRGGGTPRPPSTPRLWGLEPAPSAHSPESTSQATTRHRRDTIAQRPPGPGPVTVPGSGQPPALQAPARLQNHRKQPSTQPRCGARAQPEQRALGGQGCGSPLAS